MKKIAILGSSSAGQALASGFIRHGYEVVIGTRQKDKVIKWQDDRLAGIRLMSYHEAVSLADTVVLAVRGSAAEDVVRQVADSLVGKTILDVTNPTIDTPPTKGILRFFTNLDESLMERFQKISPTANFVKVFNSVGAAVMVNPDFKGVRPTMFICGNNTEAKQKVSVVLDKFGWETEDMGDVEAARAIEPLCILWCIPGYLRNDWFHAFKLLKK